MHSQDFTYCSGLNSDVGGPHTDRNIRDDWQCIYRQRVPGRCQCLVHATERTFTVSGGHDQHSAVLLSRRVTVDLRYLRIHGAWTVSSCVHPQRPCKLGERRSPAKNGRGTPFPCSAERALAIKNAVPPRSPTIWPLCVIIQSSDSLLKIIHFNII